MKLLDSENGMSSHTMSEFRRKAAKLQWITQTVPNERLEVIYYAPAETHTC